MKKFVTITIAGIVSILLVSFAYYALVFYPVVLTESHLWEWVGFGLGIGYYALRFGLCIAFGAWLASYRYKGLQRIKKNTASRFLKQNWIALLLVLVVAIIAIDDGNIMDLYDNLVDGVFDVFHFYENEEIINIVGDTYTVRLPGPFETPVHFIYESFLTASALFSYALLFLTYRFRGTQYQRLNSLHEQRLS